MPSKSEGRNNWPRPGKERFHACGPDLNWNLVGCDERRSPSLSRIHQERDGEKNTKEVHRMEKQPNSWITIFLPIIKYLEENCYRPFHSSYLKNLPLPLRATQSVNWNGLSKMLMLSSYLYLKILLVKPSLVLPLWKTFLRIYRTTIVLLLFKMWSECGLYLTSIKGTLMQIWKSSDVLVFTRDSCYPEPRVVLKWEIKTKHPVLYYVVCF